MHSDYCPCGCDGAHSLAQDALFDRCRYLRGLPALGMDDCIDVCRDLDDTVLAVQRSTPFSLTTSLARSSADRRIWAHSVAVPILAARQVYANSPTSRLSYPRHSRGCRSDCEQVPAEAAWAEEYICLHPVVDISLEHPQAV